MALRSTLIGAGLPILLLAAASLAFGVAGGAPERIFVVFLVNLIAVLGIGVFSGNSGILSFGHLAFMGIAAYLSGILTMPVEMKRMSLPALPDFLAAQQLDIVTAAAVSVLVVMAFAWLVGLVLCRLDGSALVIATLALLIIVHGLIIGARDITRGSQSFFGVPRDTTLLLAAAGACLALLVARVFRESVPGLKLRASREDAIAAQAVGVDVRRHRLIAWVVSAGLVALSGVLLGHFLGAFSPKKFYFVDTFALLAMLIVGGIGTVSGALAGTVLVTVVSEALRRLEGGSEVFGLTQIGIGCLILLVMYRKSSGLFGRLEWDERLLPRPLPPAAPAAPVPRPAAASGPRLLAGEDLTRRFGALAAVDGVSVSLTPGEILGLIGPNGSGKSTLLNLLSGVLPPSAGRIRLDGRDVTGAPSHRLARQGIARTFQNIRLFRTLTVQQNVLTAALAAWPGRSRAEAERAAERALAEMHILALAEREAGTLSYGDQRRVEIARALALDPVFLFLDEPAAGMNRDETDRLMLDLKRLRDDRGLGILLVDHDLPLVMRASDRLVVLNEGRIIAAGSGREVQRHPDVVAAYLGRRHSEIVLPA